MKNTQKRKSVFIAMALVLSIVLLIATGCDKGKDETKIIVGASPSPHAEILQEIVEDLKKEGVTLETGRILDAFETLMGKADLVLVEDRPFTVRREDVLSKCGWSPFEGDTFRSKIAATWVNGVLAWDGDKLVGGPQGQRLTFDR